MKAIVLPQWCMVARSFTMPGLIINTFLSPTECPFTVLANRGHTVTDPRFLHKCFPTCCISLRIAGTICLTKWATNFKWWYRFSEASIQEWIHLQRQQCSYVRMAQSAGVFTRQGHREYQDSVAAWKRQPAGCTLCWPVDLSHSYLLSGTCEVSSHHVVIF